MIGAEADLLRSITGNNFRSNLQYLDKTPVLSIPYQHVYLKELLVGDTISAEGHADGFFIGVGYGAP